MGCITTSTGTILPELIARHASTKPYVDRLTFAFFKKARAALENKYGCRVTFVVERTLLLWCVAEVERQRKAEASP